jgi:hypothetical protein
VVVVLSNAGDHIPEIPLLDVVERALSVLPLQIGATAVKDGVIIGFTLMVIVAVLAHCPALGVNVYVVVLVLFNAGNHVPEIPLFELVGSGFNTPPLQIGETCVNVGVVVGFTTIVNEVVSAHGPVELGVKM